MLLLSRALHRGRRFLLIHRRGFAAACLGLTVWLVLGEVRAGSPATVPVWTAAHDLPAGTLITAADLRRTDFLPPSVPPAAPRDRESLLGRTLGPPLARGDAVTRTDLVGSARLAGHPGRSAIGLRIPDADAAALLRPDDHVDLVASDPQQGRAAETLVRDAVVLAVPGATSEVGSATTPGRLVVFAVPSTDVEHIASIGSTLFLTVIWNR